MSRCAHGVDIREASRNWRDARRTSSTGSRPAFVSARVRGASAVVVTPSVRMRQLEMGASASTGWLLRTYSDSAILDADVIAMPGEAAASGSSRRCRVPSQPRSDYACREDS